MSKKNGQQNDKNSRNWFERRLRSFFHDWDIKVMTYVMLIVSSVAIIAATVAWFAYFPYNTVSDLDITLGDCNSLKIAIESGGADIEELKEIPGNPDSIEFSMNMPLFDNVESYMAEEQIASDGIIRKEEVEKSKLAPGVYGEVTMYLTSLNRQIDYFRITPTILLTYGDDTYDTMDENIWSVSPPQNDTETKKSMRQLVQGHILFFKEREKISDENTGKWSYSYSGQIMQNSDGTLDIGPWEDELEYDEENHIGIEKKVTIYWYWAYEYGDLPQNIRDIVETQATSYTKQLFADEDLIASEDFTQATELRLTQLYDYADTRIGANVKSMKFHFRVDGFHKLVPSELETPTEAQTETETQTETVTETETEAATVSE